jgi:undecaprenyl-diphosphatase
MRRTEVVALGLIQGPAELLPVSSSGHVAALPRLLGWEHAGLEGARRKEVEVALHAGGAVALLAGLRRELGALRIDVAVVSLVPTVAIAFLAERWIEERLGGPRSLAAGLVAGSAALVLADRAPERRREEDAGPRDAALLGLAQACALVPGVSRSGATMSAGLSLGLDRVAVTRLSFFLSIPALTAAGLYEAVKEYDEISNGIGWGPTLIGTAVSFVVAYAAIAWLLRYIAHHTFSLFIFYRFTVGALVIALVAAGAMAAT